MTAIREETQKLDLSTLLELFTIEVRDTGAIYNFTSTASDTIAVSFQGVLYFPVPCEFKNMSTTARGQFPRPTIQISTIALSLAGINVVSQYDTLLSSKFTRLRTFRRFLDGQESADPSQHFPKDIFYIHRRKAHTNESVEFELASYVDVGDVQVPRRTANRSYCSWTYRRWTGNRWVNTDLADGGCPYRGDSMYTSAGITVTDPTQDKCGKKLSDCRKRFVNADLPFGGFPGLRRL